MNKIKALFKKNDQGTLTIFYTAGYPELDSTIAIAQHLNAANIKLVEIGMPFSDPLADGTTIQHSSEIALQNGMNMRVLFKQVKMISETTNLTIVLMGYLNQLMSIGVERFLKHCQESGVSSLIIPDLPMDIYENEYQELFNTYDISISFLITPRTSAERILVADRLTSGFLYLVADNSITGGTSGNFSKEQEAYFKRIHDMNLVSPLLIGFGIKTAKQLKMANKYVDGTIIGSEFIRQISSADKVTQENISRFIRSVNT